MPLVDRLRSLFSEPDDALDADPTSRGLAVALDDAHRELGRLYAAWAMNTDPAREGRYAADAERAEERLALLEREIETRHEADIRGRPVGEQRAALRQRRATLSVLVDGLRAQQALPQGAAIGSGRRVMLEAALDRVDAALAALPVPAPRSGR